MLEEDMPQQLATRIIYIYICHVTWSSSGWSEPSIHYARVLFSTIISFFL